MRLNYRRRLRALEARIPPRPTTNVRLLFVMGKVDAEQKRKRGERVVRDYCVCHSMWFARDRITTDRHDNGYRCGNAEDLLTLARPRGRPKNPDNSLGCWRQALGGTMADNLPPLG